MPPTDEPLTLDDAVRQARLAMDTASPNGTQLPRGKTGKDLVEHITALRLACDDPEMFARLTSEPLFQLYPYEVADALGWKTAPATEPEL